MMSEETYKLLEFDKVRQILAGFTMTTPGFKLAEEMVPLEGRTEVEEVQAETAESFEFLDRVGRPPLGGCRELRPVLEQLQAEGTYLEPETLLSVASSMEAAAHCRRHYDDEKAPLLSALAAQLAPLTREVKQIRECLDERGEIRDSASFELGNIRGEQLRLRQRIKRTLDSLLQDDRLAGLFQDRLITERNGRYVVPVRADHRGQLKGFVHDESASGQTLFIEPARVLDDNNRLRALQREEQRELEKILRRLAALVRQASPQLLANQEIMARFDLRSAAARFGQACDGHAVRIEDRRIVALEGARHPLLLFHIDGSPRREPAQPIDLRLGEHHDALVISGPNTGGKTVALKTLGLLLLMVRCGLPVPCRPGSRLHLFGSVFVDIGDEQSIEQSLSTFSGHLLRLVHILDRADSESLVLLDEVGTGTDPAEGGALALAVLDTLRQRGAKAVVTTHLNLVKGYAHMEATVENAAVEFDSQTLAPTYRLHYGIPGASSAFAIARRLGVPQEVLDRANEYLGEGEREGLELIERLNLQRRDLDRELTEAQAFKRQARQERDRRKLLLRELEEEKKSILEKTARRGEQKVREAEKQVRTALKEVRSQRPDAGEASRASGQLRQARQKVSDLRPRPQPQGRRPEQVEPGEILRVTSLGAEATVVRQRGSEVELSLKGKRMRLPLKALEQFEPRRFEESGERRSVIAGQSERERFESRLLLVGRRVEEALPLLERYLDDALLHGAAEVKIVHGTGEGILRRAVHEALARNRAVSAFYAAAPEQGGDNVTVVELRQ
ncbi:MAG: endonuclease MutS2 [Desulfuromonadales bacterium]